MPTAPAQYIATQRGMSAVFREAAMQARPYYPNLCTVRQSQGKDEGYAMMGSMPGMREWIGDRNFHQLTAAQFVLENILWESGVELEKTDVDDDRLGLFSDSLSELGNEAAHHPDELLFEQAMVDGENRECWDGSNFYSTTHLWRDSGTQSNLITVSGIADPDNPTADEIKTAFHAGVKAMLGFKRDNGKFWIRPRAMVLGNLLINNPLSMHEAVGRAFTQTIALETDGTSFAGTSNFVVERPAFDTIPYIGSEGAGADNEMYLHWLGGRLRPFLFQLRSALRVDTKGADDISHKWLQLMATARYNLGYLMWPYSIKIVLAA